VGLRLKAGVGGLTWAEIASMGIQVAQR
jgi:hypothetical protein